MPPRYKYRVEEVREEYLERNGVGPAIRDALKSLFAEPRLPDNPYFYLASLLAAYVDQSPLWKQSDAEVATAFDLECAIEVLQPDTKLSRHALSSHCYGLPHVLRLVTKRGANILAHILSHGVPESFFPNSIPFRVGQGYTVQEFCSVQGGCSVWHPGLMHFPALEVRSDVLITGPRMDDAVSIFIDLVLTCVEEVGAVPLYFVDGIAIMDPPGQLYEGDKEPFYQFYRMDDILNRPEEFEKLAIRQVLGHKCIKMSCVLMLEVPEEGYTQGGEVGETESAQLRYELATKSYFFHYASLEPSTIDYDQMQHYGTMPYEALYEGYFLSLSTARQYMQMFMESDKLPYGPVSLPANMNSMRRQIERSLYAGRSLEAFRQLLHLIMIQDGNVTLAPQLSASQVRSLEQTVLTGRVRERGGLGFKALGEGILANPRVLNVIPNLLRTLASSAATIQGTSREVEALSSAGEKWPHKVRQLRQSQGRLPTAQTVNSVDSRRTLRTPEVDASMLSWLDTFDMEGKLLQQLASIKSSVQASMGKGVFSGLSFLIDQLLHRIPEETPTIGTSKLLKDLQIVMVQLVQLLHVGSLTIAHSFLGRCADIVWGLNCVGVRVTSIADVQEASGEAAMRGVGGGTLDDAAASALTPDWVLDVQSVASAQVQNGGLPERVGVEGVMLQYAVDVKLDETLSMLWHQVSQPPQPLNPFPKLMHIVRSRAAKMELWLDEEEQLLLHLTNELTLAAAGESYTTGWMYSGHRLALDDGTEGGGLAKRGGNARAVQDVEDDSACSVYGCYTAVTLADARALQALRAALGNTLLGDRSWKQGAYICEIIPSLCGDAALTNAMEIQELLRPAQEAAHNPTSASHQAHHPRFFGLEAEEHHLVTGPKRKEATQVFGKEVMEHLLKLHHQTPHLLRSLQLWVPASLAARMVDEGTAVTTAPVAALWGAPASVASTGTRSDTCTPGDTYYEGSENGAVSASGISIRPGSAATFPSTASAVGPAAMLSSISGLDLGGFNQQPGPASAVMEGRKESTLIWVTISTRAILEDAGRGGVAAALAAAARAVPYGRVLGTVSLYAAPAHLDASYMPFEQHITFQHHHVSPALRPNRAMTHACKEGSRPSTPGGGREQGYWERDVYKRIFMSDSQASTWATWNREKGDPAQPFHQEHLVEEGSREVGVLMAKGQVLEAHKLALLGAMAAQDGPGIYQLSRSCASTAQELAVLLAMNRTLADLMGEGRQDASVRAKFDTERLRRLVVVYCNCTRRAMSSPRSCYFVGLMSLVPTLLAELADVALSEFVFYARHLAALDQLAVWTKACEVSVAAALHDCIDDDVAEKWLGRPKGNGSGLSNQRAHRMQQPVEGINNARDANSGGSAVLRPGSAISRGKQAAQLLGAQVPALQAARRHTSAGGGVVRRRSHTRARTPVSVTAGGASGGGQHLSSEGELGHAKWRGGVTGALRLGAGNDPKAGLTFDKLDD